MPTPTERYLMIGDEHDLPQLRAILDLFPADAVGNVFLEMPGPRSPLLTMPRGVCLTVLPRWGGRARIEGSRACAALESWVGEWVHGAHAAAEGHAIWVGMSHNALVNRMCEALLTRHHDLHLHRPCCRGCTQGSTVRTDRIS